MGSDLKIADLSDFFCAVDIFIDKKQVIFKEKSRTGFEGYQNAMSKLKKLPSGSWTAIVFDYVDETGKRKYKSITRPTKAECEKAISMFKWEKEKRTSTPKGDMTVGEAIDKYIALSETLSPTTVFGYKQIRKAHFKTLMDKAVSKLDDAAMQAAINAECKTRSATGTPFSAKSVRNAWGLVASALNNICGAKYNVKLPRTAKKMKELPPPDAVFNAVKGTDAELPTLLAMWLSFSMSEIRGLTFGSLRNGRLNIDQVKVDAGETVVKANAKVETRNRSVECPAYIQELIRKQPNSDNPNAYIYDHNASTTYRRFKRRIKEAGYDMTFHDLRHINASVMLLLNIPDKYAMERGGWKTDHVMKSVYQHTFSKERKIVDEAVDNFFYNIVAVDNSH